MKTTTAPILRFACAILLLGTTTTFAQKRHAFWDKIRSLFIHDAEVHFSQHSNRD